MNNCLIYTIPDDMVCCAVANFIPAAQVQHFDWGCIHGKVMS